MATTPDTIPKQKMEQVYQAANLEYEGIISLCRHLELGLDPRYSDPFIKLVKDSINHLDFTYSMMKLAGVEDG